MSPQDSIRALSDNISPLSEECQAELLARSSLKTFSKGEVVVREGQYSKRAFLIVKGSGRAYYLKDGKDISDWFSFENEIMAPIFSFFGDGPSPHYCEFIEDSTALEFSKELMDELGSAHHDFERLISRIVTQTLLGLCTRLNAIQFNRAEERYEQLLQMYPNITNRMPLTHIASYLGITLETLSRIRNPKNRI